jgi:hypothetical protein
VHVINLDDCSKPIQQTHPLIINLGDQNSCKFEVITTRSPRLISHGSINVKRNWSSIFILSLEANDKNSKVLVDTMHHIN